MVRGNWQRRVERTEARRTAVKLQQQRRRSKRRSNSVGGDDRESMYRRLEDWLEDNSALLMSAYGETGVTIDMWTDERPNSRQEYLTRASAEENVQDDVEDDEAGRKSRPKKDRGGFQNKKGKQHPNTKNKYENSGNAVSLQSKSQSFARDEKYALCAQEFFFGREKCPGQQTKQKRGGGRSRSNSVSDDGISCHLLHYHQFPKVKNSMSSWVVQNSRPQTPPLTLAQVVNAKYQLHQLHRGSEQKPTSLPLHIREATLQSAFDAVILADSSSVNREDSGTNDSEVKEQSVDMIYHSRTIVQCDKIQEENNEFIDDHDSAVSVESNHESHGGDESRDGTNNIAVIEALQQILDDENLSPLNVVYISIQGVLIYDCHRGGLLISYELEQYLLYGDEFDANFGKSCYGANDESNTRLYEQLTHHILDEVLSFLCDESTGVLPQVCRAWRDEVGTRSPQLWKMLLGRRNWLSTVKSEEHRNIDDRVETTVNGDNENIIECGQYRDAFISHYLTVRDVRAISNACNFLHSGNAIGGRGSHNMKNKDGIEYAVQAFKATKGAPLFDGVHEGGRCTVKVLPSSNTSRALAAYSYDCTLRLFEAVQGSYSVGGNTNIHRMKCRQMVCVRSLPPSISRKKNRCEIADMDLDENVVACLVNECHDVDADAEVELRVTPWLTVIPCDDLMCAGNEGILNDKTIQSFDLRALILDFVMGGSCNPDSNDDATVFDSLREPLHQYLSVVDGDTSDVLISISPKLVSCGKGTFLFHSYISIPGYSLLQYEHSDDDSLGEEEVRLQSLEQIVTPSSGNRLFVMSTQSGGAIIHSTPLTAGFNGMFATRPFPRKASEHVAPNLCTNVVIQSRSTLILLKYSLKRDGTFDVKQECLSSDMREKSNIAVTPSHVVYGMKKVGQNKELFQVFDIRSPFRAIESTLDEFSSQGSKLHNIIVTNENYVVAFINSLTSAVGNEVDAFDGHWFGPDDRPSRALVYHIPSRHRIYECSMSYHSLSMDVLGNVLAFNMSTLGFVFAGVGTRGVARKAVETDLLTENDSLTSPSAKNAKCKKKRLASKTAKKDGFARGMSLRG
ncbi:hypothetical protein ACHAWX_006192 [Stephanocyclus meneghinianus]